VVKILAVDRGPHGGGATSHGTTGTTDNPALSSLQLWNNCLHGSNVGQKNGWLVTACAWSDWCTFSFTRTHTHSSFQLIQFLSKILNTAVVYALPMPQTDC